MLKGSKNVFTTGDVAEICGVTLRTVINWIRQGKLKAYRLPGARGDNRVEKQVLLEFLRRNHLPVPDYLHDSRKEQTCVALVVDDDPLMAKSIARILRKTDMSIHIADSGFEAGRLYSQLDPKIMTLDLSMPGMDGFEVLSRLRERSRTRIIVISALPDSELKRAKALGADAVLTKPFDAEQLLSLVNELGAD